MTLHKYTQEELDALPVVNGVKQCPTGDYTAILVFPERCRFGKGCSFEDGLTPFSWRAPYFAADRIGSESRKAYFFQDQNEIFWVRAGCFWGDENAFLAKLEADADNVKTAHYRAALALAKMVLTQEVER